eukprot:SAG22_NODE_3836_length_1510_cov_1.757619_2_plen_112_part_00
MLEGKTKESEVYRESVADPLCLGMNADRTLDCLVTQLRYYKEIEERELALFTVWDPVRACPAFPRAPTRNLARTVPLLSLPSACLPACLSVCLSVLGMTLAFAFCFHCDSV